ncbi:MATE family efflux transporter [Candidatus Epulonipiscium fishelsonii]|uniref:MATE family efflux transporter n=1 Tax=Candidatus Epulonipiscium fishelsonii TaxID=77094 RepID=A0ACC8XCR2_9FIRM|nr:MATE family efflux transporter [Epulopiscium sp. SCG-B11WGA-EpuloA1]ONI43211.1 MATE family efflux transporter [Epulopiscium sp. SCG-B05WGA-EpuloA1]
MNQQNDLIHGRITSSLIKFTMPILFALFLQTMYGMVDLLIVGNFGIVADVSGVSTGSQLMTLITSICTGLATGATILIGQKIGSGKDKEVPAIIQGTTIIFAIVSILAMAGILVFIDQIVLWLNTPMDAINQTTSYLFICAIGIPMIFSYNVLGSIFRGLGDSKTPLTAVGIACIINILFDLILIAGFDMGASGAAIATVFAQIFSVIVCIIIIKKRKILNFENYSKQTLYYAKDILKLGIPVALQSGLISISFLTITVIVNQFGIIFSASVGLVEKLTGIIMLVPIAFMQSLSVFVAQNYGAQQYDRIKKGLIISFSISCVFGMIMAYIGFFHGEMLTNIFSNDKEVIAAGAIYLKAYAIDTLLVPCVFCLSGYFNGCGKTFFVMIQGIFGSVVLRIPFILLFSLVEPVSLFNIGLAIPISTAIQIVICVIYYLKSPMVKLEPNSPCLDI